MNTEKAPVTTPVKETGMAIAALPEKTILYVNDTLIENTDDQVAAIRAYLRAKLLKQFGVSSINGENVSAMPLAMGAGRVATSLKLPKVTTNPAGEIIETLAAYHQRCLPAIRLWFKNSIHNSAITVEDVTNIQ